MTEDEGAEASLSELRDTLWTLRDYLPELMLIGGWVPELYRRYGTTNSWQSKLSYTFEADILVHSNIHPAGRVPISSALMSAGFRPQDGPPFPAVWLHESRPAKVEFLVGMTVPAMRRGRSQLVGGQPGLGALALPEDLNNLWKHQERLRLTWMDGQTPRELEVMVPKLGAYVTSKAITSQDRPVGSAFESKRTKDLLYLHDLMAAGEEVVQKIEDDIRAMGDGDSDTKIQLRRAHDRLRDLSASEVEQVSEMLAERNGGTLEIARRDIKGHLEDLADVFEAVLDND